MIWKVVLTIKIFYNERLREFKFGMSVLTMILSSGKKFTFQTSFLGTFCLGESGKKNIKLEAGTRITDVMLRLKLGGHVFLVCRFQYIYNFFRYNPSGRTLYRRNAFQNLFQSNETGRERKFKPRSDGPDCLVHDAFLIFCPLGGDHGRDVFQNLFSTLTKMDWS